MNRILIVEDEPRLASFLEKGLRANGFTTTTVHDGYEATALASDSEFDLMVLDLGLPGKDGLSVLRDVRAGGNRMPVVILSARDDTDVKVAGLERGADDYVAKPFSPRELVARVRALLRRADRSAALPGDTVRVGSLTIDPATRRVTRDGRDAYLTPTEFDLLYRLAQTPHVVYGRRRLLEEVWGYRVAAGERTVDSHVRALRRKLGADLIRTVHGIGYAFDTNGLV
jgi:DNA-binding response OmpR family regulator